MTRSIATRPTRARNARWLALLLSLLLLAAACGGGEQAADPTEAPDGTAAETDDGDTDGEGDGDVLSADGPTFHLRFTSLYGPDGAVSESIQWWADEITRRSNGRITFEMFYAGSLLAPADTLPGVAAGQAEAGFIVPVYTPADTPIYNIAMVPGLGQNTESHARALGELANTNELWLAEQERTGVKLMAFVFIGPMGVGTPDRIDNVGQLEGRRIRTISYVATAHELLGMNPVALPVPETYEALQRGVVDAYSFVVLDSVPGAGLHEVAPWIFDTRLGIYGTVGLGISQSVFEEMPEDLQRVVLEVSEAYYDHAVEVWAEEEDAACQVLLDAGGGVTTISDEELEAWKADIGDRLQEMYISEATQHGLSREQVDGLIEEFRSINERLEPQAQYESGVARCAERTPAA